MTDDRVYPASKPPGIVGGGGGGATTNPTFSANKAQLYSANRPAYRPPAGRRRSSHSRGCCCRCCCWTIFVIILLVLLVAAASAVVYLIYRPQRPNFSVSSLKISSLNFTSATHLTTAISLSVIARNPNKNVGFLYDDTDITLYKSATGGGDDDDVVIGKGSIPSFVHGKKNTTLLRSTIGSPPGDLDEISAGKLKGDLKAKKGVAIKIVLNTKVKVKMGSLKTPKSGIRVTCEGIKLVAPTGKKPTTAVTSAAKCKVDPRFKIWKITF
ncbi:PREDICTED: protein YLS9-like [Camelina sativa]|uniref:Protein YLS9-like n=1 Tax=Camelina sativa TaxID=90675 RepID=A0ABM0VPS2_CAMSA|nr:PREDICTED: protein YLS9-like [Camelina sativa]